MDWIMHPFLAYAFQALGLGLCLYLFFSLQREARRRDVNGAGSREAVEGRIEDLRAVVEEVRRNLRDVEDRVVPAAPLPIPAGLNLNKRAQALRMHRRGEASETIAASLALPQREVELMVKLQRILAERN